MNPLPSPACAVRPELGRLRAAAAEILGRQVHVTGSGSAMFAFASDDRAESLADAVRQGLPGVTARVARLV